MKSNTKSVKFISNIFVYKFLNPNAYNNKLVINVMNKNGINITIHEINDNPASQNQFKINVKNNVINIFTNAESYC